MSRRHGAFPAEFDADCDRVVPVAAGTTVIRTGLDQRDGHTVTTEGTTLPTRGPRRRRHAREVQCDVIEKAGAEGESPSAGMSPLSSQTSAVGRVVADLTVKAWWPRCPHRRRTGRRQGRPCGG